MQFLRLTILIAIFSSQLIASPDAGAAGDFQKKILNYLEGEDSASEVCDVIFSSSRSSKIESQLNLLTSVIAGYVSAKRGLPETSDIVLMNRILKLQDSIDVRLIDYRLRQRAFGTRARWIGAGVGLGLGAGFAYYATRNTDREGFSGIFTALFWMFAPAGGTALGLGVGEVISRSQSNPAWASLVPASTEKELKPDSKDAYVDLGALIREYVNGATNSRIIAETLVAEPKSLERRLQYVLDEIRSEVEDINQREYLLYNLKHELCVSITKHNEQVFVEQDRNRVMGMVGGAGLSVAAGYIIIPRLLNASSWGEMKGFGIALMPAFIVAGATVGSLGTPLVEHIKGDKSAIRAVTNLD